MYRAAMFYLTVSIVVWLVVGNFSIKRKIEDLEELLHQQQEINMNNHLATQEMVNGINRNLKNLGVFYDTTPKEDTP